MAPKNSERMENYTVRLHEDTLRMLNERAEKEGVRPSELVRLMLSEALGASVRTENSIRLAVETLQHDLKQLTDLALLHERQLLSGLGMLLLNKMKQENVAHEDVKTFVRDHFYESLDMGEALRPAFQMKGK